jgi:hypothetical protein
MADRQMRQMTYDKVISIASSSEADTDSREKAL